MKIYIHSANRKLNLVSVEPHSKVGELICQVVPELAGQPDYNEDLEIYKQDSDEELFKDRTLAESGVKDRDHLHISRSKKITVAVIYAGQTYSSSYNTANSLKKVFKEATKHFNIPEEDKASLYLYLSSNSESKIELDEHVGSLVNYPTCSIQLYLSREKGVQG